MAAIVKTSSGTWKALIRKTGWPSTAKSFRTKRDAEDWARRTEDEMVRGVYIQRAPAERMTVEAALARYLKEVPPTKRATKTRQFQRETFLPVFSTKHQKNPTPCKIALPKARETTMSEMGSHETELTKTISGAERDRRVAAVNYARASVGLEGFSLSAADEEHAQRFIDGDIDLEEFVQPRSALASPKA